MNVQYVWTEELMLFLNVLMHSVKNVYKDGGKKSSTCPMCRGMLPKNNEEDWVLTGSGPEGKEVTNYLTQCLQEYSK